MRQHPSPGRLVAALARATKEYEESFAEDLFGNLELYEQASLNGDLTNAEARRARLVEDLDARWAATEGNTANEYVPGLWDERVNEGWFDGAAARRRVDLDPQPSWYRGVGRGAMQVGLSCPKLHKDRHGRDAGT